jgi:hypothetical protein
MYWIASYPKAGNTWVRLFLEAYVLGNTDINNCRVTTGDINEYFLDNVAPAPVDTLHRLDMLGLRAAALVHIKHAYRPVAVKTHHANVLLHEVKLIPTYLTDGVVYVMRDPRDLVISKAAYFDQSIDQAIELLFNPSYVANHRGAENRYHYLGAWRAHIESYLNEKNYPVLPIRYEQLLTDPVTHFTMILHFLNCDVDHDRVMRCVNATRFDRCRERELAAGFKENKSSSPFFRAGQAGQWVSVLNHTQLARLDPLVRFYESISDIGEAAYG